MSVRPAEPRDVPALLACIRALAEYEREPDAVVNTEAMLHAHLFGPNPQVFALVAEDADGVAGIAIWFPTYSTWEGVHGLHLEDLFVHPERRGAGHGLALMRALAAICVERGWARFEWQVLDWNEPSIRFYESLGATAMDGWHTRRLTGAPLRRLAEQADAEGLPTAQ